MCQEFKCNVCKKIKTFKTFKDLVTHCLREKDRAHIELVYNDLNSDDWVECGVCKESGGFYKASRIDFHLKKFHKISNEQYIEKFHLPLMSKNYREKIANSGRHANDGKDLSGENNPFFGWNHSEKSKQKISNGIIESNALLEKHFNKDRKASDETRDKMSKSRTGDKNPMYGKRRSSIVFKNKFG